jgi:hypothetical protein
MKTKTAGLCGVLGLAVAAAVTAACSSGPAAPSQAALQEKWRDTMVRNPSPETGCFHAAYPSTTWERVACGPAPTRIYGPRHGTPLRETAGGGTDYAAQVSGTISQTVGTFPTATGTAGETDNGANVYSIQLNSNFMPGSKACGTVSGCQSWQQFVYASGEQLGFIQSWLIGMATCPTTGGWMANGGNCYRNSTTVSVPQISSDQIGQLKMSGTAATGNDSLVFTNGTNAYNTNTPDSTTYLSAGWSASEFNVIGDGNSSAATFQPGTSITVNIAVTGGSPSCQSNAGTTAETNNLTLGSCSASGGSIQFTETLAGGDAGSEAGADASKDGGTDGGEAGEGGNEGGDAADEAGDDGGDEAGDDGGDGGDDGGGDDGGAGDDGGGGGGDGGVLGGGTCNNSEKSAPSP